MSTLLKYTFACIFTFSLYYFLSDCFVISFEMEPKSDGEIQCQQYLQDGSVVLSSVKKTHNSKTTFFIKHSTKDYNFLFKPTKSPYKVKSLCFFWLVKYKSNVLFQNPKLSLPIVQQEILAEGQPLNYYITEKYNLVDYTQFFDQVFGIYKVLRSSGFFFLALITLVGYFYLFSKLYPESWYKVKVVSAKASKLCFNKVTYFISVIIVLLMTLPCPVIPIQEGLDPSWIWSLNYFISAKNFGKELVFTYGPLGAILFPQNCGNNVLVTLLFNIVYLIILGCSLLSLPQNHYSKWLLLLCVFIPIRTLEWQWVVLPLLTMSICCFSENCSKPKAVIFSSLTALIFVVISFIKVSIFVIVLPTCILMMTYLWVVRSNNNILVPCSFLASFVLTVLLCRLYLFETWGTLYSWLLASIEISSGYNLCMLCEKSFLQLFCPYLYFFLLLSFLTINKQINLNHFLKIVVFLPVFYCLVKYSILRQSIIPLVFVGAYIGGILSVFSENLNRFRYSFISSILIFIAYLMSPLYISTGLASSENITALPFKNLQKTIYLKESKALADQASISNISKYKLSKEWIDLIGTNTVQCLPSDTTYIPANSLNLSPFYSMQCYSAYTHKLDLICASRYSIAPPQYIIAQFSAIDGRHMTLECPETWTTIFEKYSILKRGDDVLLLALTEKKPQSTNHLESSLQIDVNEWFDVSALDSDSCSFVWNQTLFGKLYSFLFRNDITFISIEYEDGTIGKYRVLPDTLKGRVNIKHVPKDFNSFCELFSKDGKPLKTKKIRFENSNNKCYSNIMWLI